MPTLGERIRAGRKRRGFKQGAVARSLGVHPKTISRWENDKLKPGSVRLAQLTQLLGDLTVAKNLPESGYHPHAVACLVVVQVDGCRRLGAARGRATQILESALGDSLLFADAFDGDCGTAYFTQSKIQDAIKEAIRDGD